MVEVKPQGVVVMDFTSFVFNKTVNSTAAAADTLTIKVTTKDKVYTMTVNIGTGSTPAATAAAVAATLEDNGFTDVSVSGAVVTLKGPAPNEEAFTAFSLDHANKDNNDPAVNTSGF